MPGCCNCPVIRASATNRAHVGESGAKFGFMNFKAFLTTGKVPVVHPAAMFLFMAFLAMSLITGVLGSFAAFAISVWM